MAFSEESQTFREKDFFLNGNGLITYPYLCERRTERKRRETGDLWGGEPDIFIDENSSLCVCLLRTFFTSSSIKKMRKDILTDDAQSILIERLS